MKTPQKKKSHSRWLSLVNIPFQMGVIIFLGTFFGTRLDSYFGYSNALCTIILSLVSVFIALYNVIRQLKDLNKDP